MCFILEIVAYIIMILMCAIAAILLLVNKQKWAQAISRSQCPGIEYSRHRRLGTAAAGSNSRPQPVVLQGAIVHARTSAAKPTLNRQCCDV